MSRNPTLTEMWEAFNHLKNLQLLKSKVDLLEPSDLKDQLLLEIERHQTCLSIAEFNQLSKEGINQDGPEGPKGNFQYGRSETRDTGRLTGSQAESTYGQSPEVKRKGFNF